MIRIASMVGGPDLQAPTLAAFSGDLAAAFARLAELGYDGVELMTKNPAALDGEEIRRLLAAHGLNLTGLCSGHVFGEDQAGAGPARPARQPRQRLRACKNLWISPPVLARGRWSISGARAASAM